MYTTRPATEADYPVMLHYGKHFAAAAGWVADLGYDPASVIPWLDLCASTGTLLVLETEGEVVGMAGGIISPFFFNKDILQGVELFWWIEPAHRNGGAGKTLRIGLEDAAKAAGVKKWTMVALAHLEPEKVGAMYERAGYELYELSYTKAF